MYNDLKDQHTQTNKLHLFFLWYLDIQIFICLVYCLFLLVSCGVHNMNLQHCAHFILIIIYLSQYDVS